MKALITAFAFAAVVFAFHTKPVMANTNIWGWDEAWEEYKEKKRRGEYRNAENIDNLSDPGQADNERDVADSGEEGSTSAAGATDVITTTSNKE